MATLSQAGIPLSGNGILHPKHRNRFQVQFINLAGISGANPTNITRQVVVCNRPALSFEEIPLHRYNSIAYVAGKHSWEQFNVTLEDDLTGLATAAVQAQLERQQRLIGADSANGQWLNAASTASAYKFGTKLMMLDGNEAVSEEWIMEGCWLQNVSYGDLDYSSADAVQISLTIRYDHARQSINNNVAGIAGINATAGFVNG